MLTIPEAIAKLDALERQLDLVKSRLREIRYELVESLDNPETDGLN